MDGAGEQTGGAGHSQSANHLGIAILQSDAGEIRAAMAARSELMALNGSLHAGSVGTLADTVAG